MVIGFSTGSLALGDFNKALSFLSNKNVNAVELSALREIELQELLDSLDNLDLKQFNYISFHAPSKLKIYSEETLVELLYPISKRKWPIIIHPDIISNFEIWKKLGKYLCIENMDKRKNVGKVSEDLEMLFKKLPEASLCFDIAHVKQVDPTMNEAISMLKQFGEKILQLHVSDVNSNSSHEPLNREAILAFRKIVKYIPINIPVILESPVSENDIQREIEGVKNIFNYTKEYEFTF